MKLVKRNKTYWLDYTTAGKRVRKSLRTKNFKSATAFLKRLNLARQMPSYDMAVEVLRSLYQKETPSAKTPISAIYETYERTARAVGKFAHLSESTRRLRKNTVERLVEWLRTVKVASIEDISGAVAAEYAAHLARSGRKTKTRRNILGDLSSVWKLLEKTSAEIRNPWANLAPPDTDAERGKAFTPDQESRVLEAAKAAGRDWYEICEVMRCTGLRYGDVARLEWREIQGGVIRMLPSKTKRHKIAVAIPLVGEALLAVERLPKRGDFLFPVHAEFYGSRSSKDRAAAGLRFGDILEAAGVVGNGYTIHSWRHTAATRLAGAGVDIETRKRILGHTVDETARRYDHDEHLAETRKALESAAK